MGQPTKEEVGSNPLKYFTFYHLAECQKTYKNYRSMLEYIQAAYRQPSGNKPGYDFNGFDYSKSLETKVDIAVPGPLQLFILKQHQSLISDNKYYVLLVSNYEPKDELCYDPEKYFSLRELLYKIIGFERYKNIDYECSDSIIQEYIRQHYRPYNDTYGVAYDTAWNYTKALLYGFTSIPKKLQYFILAKHVQKYRTSQEYRTELQARMSKTEEQPKGNPVHISDIKFSAEEVDTLISGAIVQLGHGKHQTDLRSLKNIKANLERDIETKQKRLATVSKLILLKEHGARN